MDSYVKNILDFPSQLSKKGLVSSGLSRLRGGKPDAIIVAGMGGSGLAGEVLAAHRAEVKLGLPVFLWKDYGLPDLSAWGARKPLYVFTSFSGNTEETVSGLKAALKAKARVAVIAAGGELWKIAERNELPRVSFPAGDLTPRQATGRMFYALINILEAAGTIPSYKKTFTSLRAERFEAPAKALARTLKGRVVAIYADYAHRDLGYLWKIKFNETGKEQAFLNVIPEMDHNEIVSYEHPQAKTTAIFIVGRDHARLQKKMRITASLVKRAGTPVIELDPGTRPSLETVWTTIMTADWASYFLAKLQGDDPTEVAIIEKLKDLMKR